MRTNNSEVIVTPTLAPDQRPEVNSIATDVALLEPDPPHVRPRNER